MRKLEVDDEVWSTMVAEDMLWHAEHSEDKKVRKACRRVAAYYMTYEQCVKYFGREEADEFFK